MPAVLVGDRIPAATLNMRGRVVNVRNFFGNKTAVVFGGPGAFTRVCTERHLPGFRDRSSVLRAMGVDFVGCLAVNDSKVLKAWAKYLHVGGSVTFIADYEAKLTKCLGLAVDLSEHGLGIRCRRFAMILHRSRVLWMGFDEAAFVEAVERELPSCLHAVSPRMSSGAYAISLPPTPNPDRTDLGIIAKALCAEGKGILAADVTPERAAAWFDSCGLRYSEEQFADFLATLLSSNRFSSYVAGVMLSGRSMATEGGPALMNSVHVNPDVLFGLSANEPGDEEAVAGLEGMDDLADRCRQYFKIGARFIRWTVVFGDRYPTDSDLSAAVQTVCDFASIAQANRLVPVMEIRTAACAPCRRIHRSAIRLEKVLAALVEGLLLRGVLLEACIIALQMVTPGKLRSTMSSSSSVASSTTPLSTTADSTDDITFFTIRSIRRTVPVAVAGLFFCCDDDQTDIERLRNLNRLNQTKSRCFWPLSFCLPNSSLLPSLRKWNGGATGVAVEESRRVFMRRVKAYSQARRGELIEQKKSFTDNKDSDEDWNAEEECHDTFDENAVACDSLTSRTTASKKAMSSLDRRLSKGLGLWHPPSSASITPMSARSLA